MEPTHRRVLPAAIAAVVLVVSTVVFATPAEAARRVVTYDALGDSYAAGFGLPTKDTVCGRSKLAHPSLVGALPKVDLDDFVACAGSGLADLPGQLAALDADTDLVTLSLGGNDVGWTQVIAACALGGDDVCAGAVAQSIAVSKQLPNYLVPAYAGIRAKAPNAHVAVTGYPRLFSPEFGAYKGTMVVDLGGGPMTLPFEVTVAEQKLMNGAADELNAAIKASVKQAGVQYVDVASKFKGHGVNARFPWITGPSAPGPFHPTIVGQLVYAAAVTAAVGSRLR